MRWSLKEAYNPMAVHINKAGNAVRVYGRVVSGARDMNFKAADSFFTLIDRKVSNDFTRYTFTNDGNKSMCYLILM